MKKKQYKLESGDISVVLLTETMALYRKKKLIVELTKDEGRDLMICFFDMMGNVNKQQEIKGKRKPKTSKHSKAKK